MKKSTLLFAAVLSSMTMFAQAPKRVVVEDFTGTWCGYCPRGKTTIGQCIAAHATTIGMEVHNGDTYANTYSNAIITGINPSGFPMGAIDRFAFGGSTSAFDTGSWVAKSTTRLNTSTPVKVDITSTYNSSTKALSVTITCNFVAAASGDMRINCVLAEDGVVTTGDPQHNYMDQTVGDPWYGMGATMPNYVHDGVARVNLAPTWGTATVIPASVTSGATYSQNYTYTLPATWGGVTPNPAKIYIVAFVNKYGTASTSHEIMNANKVLMGSSTATGIFENPNVDQIQVAQNTPNPFNEMTAMDFTLNTTDMVKVTVYNSFGQVVNNLFNDKLIPGQHTFYWGGTDNEGNTVAAGVYYYTISTTNSQVTKPMVFTGR